MHLIQILLPIADNSGKPFPRSHFSSLRRELTSRFGGVTVYARSLAEGFWERQEGQCRDDIVIFEVITDDLDEVWWRDRRDTLEREFRQDEIIIRAMKSGAYDAHPRLPVTSNPAAPSKRGSDSSRLSASAGRRCQQWI